MSQHFHESLYSLDVFQYSAVNASLAFFDMFLTVNHQSKAFDFDSK